MLVASTVTASTIAPMELEEHKVEAQIAPVAKEIPKNDPEYINALIVRYSSILGVSEALMRDIIKGESGFNPTKVGDKTYICTNPRTVPGQISPSYGLVQINIACYHPHVTKEQALDPEFSVRFLAQGLADGHCSWWTVCRNLVQ